MKHSVYSIGLLLQDKRMHLGLSIPDVSKAIKIRPKYIIAIEHGETAAIIIPAYIIGYIRIYAHFLGLNGEAIIIQMKEAGIPLEKAADLHIPPRYYEESYPSVFIIICSFIMLLLTYGGWYYNRLAEHSRSAQISEISQLLSEFSFISSLLPSDKNSITAHRQENIDYTLTPLLASDIQPNSTIGLFAKHYSWITLYKKNGAVLDYYLREGEWFFFDTSENSAVTGNKEEIEIMQNMVKKGD